MTRLDFVRTYLHTYLLFRTGWPYHHHDELRGRYIFRTYNAHTDNAYARGTEYMPVSTYSVRSTYSVSMLHTQLGKFVCALQQQLLGGGVKVSARGSIRTHASEQGCMAACIGAFPPDISRRRCGALGRVQRRPRVALEHR